ncbi:MAG: hypothetical protein IJT36_08520 [Alphaproteobacteria bacterium]|nr:hypothetical protein [Alphaproteobacteria bacterium]
MVNDMSMVNDMKATSTIFINLKWLYYDYKMTSNIFLSVSAYITCSDSYFFLLLLLSCGR